MGDIEGRGGNSTGPGFELKRARAPLRLDQARSGARGTPFSGALTVSAALSGNAADITPAQFTFAGCTYLAINQAARGFQDGTDILLDITGATGTIDAGEFIT